MPNNANICVDCERACGGCSWSAVDEDTGRVRFEPVPGWTAEPVTLRNHSSFSDIRTYHITACPQFIPTPPRRGSRAELSPRSDEAFLKDWRKFLRQSY